MKTQNAKVSIDYCIQNERDIIQRNQKITNKINRSQSSLGIGVPVGNLGGH